MFNWGKKKKDTPLASTNIPTSRPYNYIFNSNDVKSWMSQNQIPASMYQEIERVLNDLVKRIEKLEMR